MNDLLSNTMGIKPITRFTAAVVAADSGTHQYLQHGMEITSRIFLSLGLMLGILAVVLNMAIASIAFKSAAYATLYSLNPCQQPMRFERRMTFCMRTQFLSVTIAGFSLTVLSLLFDYLLGAVTLFVTCITMFVLFEWKQMISGIGGWHVMCMVVSGCGAILSYAAFVSIHGVHKVVGAAYCIMLMAHVFYWLFDLDFRRGTGIKGIAVVFVIPSLACIVCGWSLSITIPRIHGSEVPSQMMVALVSISVVQGLASLTFVSLGALHVIRSFNRNRVRITTFSGTAPH